MTTPTQDPPVTAGADFEALLTRARAYLPEDRLGALHEAHAFAADCHAGQERRSGEPYITHPVAVTLMVAGLELDQHALTAALLHDVVEDCGVAPETIVSRFGPEVGRLVDGLTKLDRMPIRIAAPREDGARESWQSENLRKIFLAMAEDIRVVLIKLCDRLHNMRTLWALSPEKQRRIARETMEVYAPLASRLGVWQVKWELEDLAFRYLQPQKYAEIVELVDAKRASRERDIDEHRQIVLDHLGAAGIKAEVSGRAKHIFSIYDKMQRYEEQAKSFEQIYDLLALRIIVDTVAQCYHALGVVHALWRPISGQFDDYIANPKDSLYQSLHTTVVGLRNRPLEVQIRTPEMHRVAEYGVAAHWRYKEGGKQARDEERIAWLRQLLEWQRDLAGADEFVESLKTDVFQDQVFVYTPKGEVIDLPAGATPLDFAYRIHTDLGNQTVGAKVNGRMVALNTTLRTGDVVEIHRSRTSKGPSRDWLNANLGYVRTTHSKTKIRQWFRKQQRTENVERRREIIERESRRLALALHDRQDQLLQMFGYTSWDDFLAALGYGGVSTTSIARRLGAIIDAESAPQPPVLPETPAAPAQGSPSMRVLGVGNLLTTMARCCNPLPGDQITGYITRSRGLTIHRADCQNVLNEEEQERLIEVEWGTASRLYPAAIRIEAWDRVGLLRDITTLVTGEKVNMVGVRTVENTDGTVSVIATLETTGIEQLSRLLSRIEIIRGVQSVERSVERKRPRAR